MQDGQAKPNRLYVLEGTLTITGTMADERLAAPPDRVAAVLRRLGGNAGEKLDAREESFAGKLAADLAQHRGSMRLLVGNAEPSEIHGSRERSVSRQKFGPCRRAISPYWRATSTRDG